MAAGEACKDWGVCECSIPKDSTLTNGKPFATLTSQRREALFLRPRYPTAGVAEGNPTTLLSYTLGGDSRAGRLESGRHGGATPGTKTGQQRLLRGCKEAWQGGVGRPARIDSEATVTCRHGPSPFPHHPEVYRWCGVRS